MAEAGFRASRHGPNSPTGCASGTEFRGRCGSDLGRALETVLKLRVHRSHPFPSDSARDDARPQTTAPSRRRARRHSERRKADEPNPRTPRPPRTTTPGAGLSIRRLFSTADTHPFDAVEWEPRDARIGHGDRVAFEQTDVEFPKSWSQNATNIVAQKYFRGQLGNPEREHSVKQMIGRVAGTIAGWGARARLLRHRRGRARPSRTS